MKTAKTNTATREEKIVTFFKSLKTEIEILDYIDTSEVNSYDDVIEQLNDKNGFDVEVIYYSNAIEYLKQNDPSLKDSIEIALEYGYELKDISSEILASLLKSKIAREEIYDLSDEIEVFFTELNEEEEL